MYLTRIQLDPRSKEARRDLSDPYQMHSSLCRAFFPPESPCPRSEFLWRMEPETGPDQSPYILVQSRSVPDWSAVSSNGWLAKNDPPIDLKQRLALDSLEAGRKFRFRIRANPCVKRNGKRLGLFRREEQEDWIMKKGKLHGFSLPQAPCQDFYAQALEQPAVSITQEQMLTGKQHKGNVIRVYSALFDGVLMVREPSLFTAVLQDGIGHGKVMGLGMLSVIPVP